MELKNLSGYAYICIGAVLLTAVSLIAKDSTYMILWVLTYMYGILGIANEEGLKGHPNAQNIINFILFILYIVMFIGGVNFLFPTMF